MKVISIGTDRKVFKKDSAVSQRIAEYRKLFDEWNVVIWKGNIFNIFRIAKKYDVVTVQDPFETGIIGVFLKLFYGLPLQIQLHTDFNNKYFLLSSPLNFIRFFIAHLTLPFADSIRVVSERVKNGIKELNKNISILPIHVEKLQITNYKLQTKGENIKVLTVARLEKEKNLATAINAFAKAVKDNPNAEFVIVGEGRERKNLERLAKVLNIADKIKFAGWQNDLSQFYQETNIYISTSLFEGYGMSMIEAGSAKMPMVISGAGIAGEVFKDGESAFVCKPNDITCFAEALDKLIKGESLRMQMGEAAHLAVVAHQISHEDYLANFKKGIESAVINFEQRSLVGRVIEFIKSFFRGNKVLRFILAGGTAALSQILTLYLLTELLDIWYLYSSIISFGEAIVVSFLLQKFWAFRDRELSGVHIQFVKYAVVISLGAAINTALMYFFVDIVGLWYILSQIITGALIAVFNFLSYRKFIFTR